MEPTWPALHHTADWVLFLSKSNVRPQGFLAGMDEYSGMLLLELVESIKRHKRVDEVQNCRLCFKCFNVAPSETRRGFKASL